MTEMTDTTPTIGHNQGPLFDPEQVAAINAKAAEFIEASQKWLEVEQVTTEEQASALTDQIDGLRKLHKKVEDQRKDAKQPFLDAGKAVDAAFSGIKGQLETCGKRLKAKLEPYLIAQAEKAAAEERARREAAEKAAREAAEAESAAQAQNSLAAEFEAEEKAKAAKEAEKAAKAKVATGARSATGAGRTVSLRMVREVEVTNVRLLFMHYQAHPKVAEVLQGLAAADVRAADVDHTTIPGIVVHERKVAT